MKRKKQTRTAVARAKAAKRKTSAPNTQAKSKPSCEKVRAHRARMRKRGYRLVQMWLPDTRTKEFAERAHRASLAIANSPTEADDQAFVDSISWWNSPEAAELDKDEPPWWRTDGTAD
jgi:hypothetical protein